MGSESRLSVPALQIHRVVAGALEGDRTQLSRAVALVLAGDDLALRSLEPALYRVGVGLLGSGEGKVEELRKVAIRSAAWRLLLEKARRGVGQVLGQIGCPWLPIKGMDTSDRFFERPEDRPSSDLDILVPPEHFPGARKALAEAGWRLRCCWLVAGGGLHQG